MKFAELKCGQKFVLKESVRAAAIVDSGLHLLVKSGDGEAIDLYMQRVLKLGPGSEIVVVRDNR